MSPAPRVVACFCHATQPTPLAARCCVLLPVAVYAASFSPSRFYVFHARGVYGRCQAQASPPYRETDSAAAPSAPPEMRGRHVCWMPRCQRYDARARMAMFTLSRRHILTRVTAAMPRALTREARAAALRAIGTPAQQKIRAVSVVAALCWPRQRICCLQISGAATAGARFCHVVIRAAPPSDIAYRRAIVRDYLYPTTCHLPAQPYVTPAQTCCSAIPSCRPPPACHQTTTEFSSARRSQARG